MLKISVKDEFKTRVLISESFNSLRKFSDSVGVSHSYISQILSRKGNPSPYIAFKIAHSLNRQTDDIFLIKSVDTSTCKKVDA